MTEADRRRLSQLDAERRAIRKRHNDARRKMAKAEKREREKRTGKARRDFDADYVGWLHEDLPCIACVLFGPPETPGRIEAAHQKLNAPSRGVNKRLGVRPSDLWCVPLCTSHHREGPLRCDPAQAKFWDVIGLEPEQVADFCIALHRAFEAEADGAPVIHEFASLAASQRLEAAP
ncbi:MAG: hypothetical protein DI570_16475 [Phenylobacterium zucineum]|nr:MAG: hypothetical protein DI570_16475 [Phenylobacterium zucineum]